MFALGIVEPMVADFLDQLAFDVLGLCHADMLADAPINSAEVGFVVVFDRKAPHQHEPTPVFQLMDHSRQLFGEAIQGEIVFRDVLLGQALFL